MQVPVTRKANRQKQHGESAQCVIAQFLSWLYKWLSNGRLCHQHGNNSTRRHLGMSLTPNVSDVLSSRVSLASGTGRGYRLVFYRPLLAPYTLFLLPSIRCIVPISLFLHNSPLLLGKSRLFIKENPTKWIKGKRQMSTKGCSLWTISNLAKSQMTALLCVSVP